MGIFELNLTMPEDFLLLAIIPSKLYVFGHIFGRSKSYRKALPSRCSSQLELSGTLSPISGLFYSGGGEKIHFQAQSACKTCNLWNACFFPLFPRLRYPARIEQCRFRGASPEVGEGCWFSPTLGGAVGEAAPEAAGRGRLEMEVPRRAAGVRSVARAPPRGDYGLVSLPGTA